MTEATSELETLRHERAMYLHNFEAMLKTELAIRAQRDAAEKLVESLQNRWASRDLTIERLRTLCAYAEQWVNVPMQASDAAALRQALMMGSQGQVPSWIAGDAIQTTPPPDDYDAKAHSESYP